MSLLLDIMTGLLVSSGAFFFVTGIVGLFRFPDVYCRLHALTKADNAGLGFVVLGVALQAPSLFVVIKLLLIWVFVLIASSGLGTLIAESALQKGVVPWKP